MVGPRANPQLIHRKPAFYGSSMNRWPLLALLVLASSGCRAGGGGSEAVTIDVGDLPATIAASAGGDDARFESYACGQGGEFPGREVVYRVELLEGGFFLASITEGAAGVAGVALLGSLDAADCLDAHADTVGARVEPGEAFVVVELPPGDDAGAFTLQLALTTQAALEGFGASAELAADALEVLGNAWRLGASRRREYTFVDFTRHSAEPREWVVDLATGELLWHLRVAHGRRSTDGVDLAHAITFSNVPESNQSSLGLMRSTERYVGVFGPSFRLEGLEPGFNDNVCVRDIVMHPWSAMNDEYVDRCGWARPSLGCPAIDDSISLPVRDRLARPDGAGLDQGALLLFWYPGTDWQASSRYLHPGDDASELIDQLAVECEAGEDVEPTPPLSTEYACD